MNNVLLVVATNHEEYRNCMKIVKREMKNSDYTIVILTEDQKIGIEEQCYTVNLRKEEMELLFKKMENIVITESEKGELHYETILREVQHKK